MRLKNGLLAIGTVAIATLLAQCGRSINTSKKLKTGVDSFSYINGLSFAKNMKSNGLTELDWNSFIKGFEDAMKKDSGYAIKEEKFRELMGTYVKSAQQKLKKVASDAAVKWLADNKKKEGVESLTQPGQYKLVKAGTGAKPMIYDSVVYNITISNVNGKVLNKMGDKRPQPVSFGGFGALEEAFMKTNAGSSFKLFVDANQYVLLEGISNQNIDAKNSVLVLDIDLVDVKKGDPNAKPAKPMMPPSEEIPVPR